MGFLVHYHYCGIRELNASTFKRHANKKRQGDFSTGISASCASIVQFAAYLNWPALKYYFAQMSHVVCFVRDGGDARINETISSH